MKLLNMREKPGIVETGTLSTSKLPLRVHYRHCRRGYNFACLIWILDDQSDLYLFL